MLMAGISTETAPSIVDVCVCVCVEGGGGSISYSPPCWGGNDWHYGIQDVGANVGRMQVAGASVCVSVRVCVRGEGGASICPPDLGILW